MKKLLFCLLVFVSIVLLMTSCDLIAGIVGGSDANDHVHLGGEATCSNVAICDECGESYGTRGEHSYTEATCTTAKTCTVCGQVVGTMLQHEWKDATCTDPKTCLNCGQQQGTALGHSLGMIETDEGSHWRTCARCNLQIEKAEHSGGTADCKSGRLCSVCNVEYTQKGEHKWAEASCTTPKTCTVCGATEGGVSHSYNSRYSHSDTEHWIECSGCGDKQNSGVHTGGEATVNDKAICEICGARYGDYLEFTVDWKTEALLPLDGANVRLANERISGWYAGYDYRSTDTDAHWLEADVFTPDVPVLKWSVGESAKYYKVFVATDSDFKDAQCYLTNLCELSIEHLYVDTTYYWYVDAVYGEYTVRSEVFTFTTMKSPRTVNIDGVSNSRDIGGYITVDGLRIKQGMIYRSAKLDDITELGKYTLVNILGVKTDLDLRGSRTVANDGSVYMDPKNATDPVSELNHITIAAPWYSTGENGIWYDDFNKAELAKAIKVFADPDNYPIIFHCSLGRDRTGTLALVLGGLLGLDENTLMMEYELSVFSYWGAYGSTKYNNGLRNSIHNTYLYIEDNYEGDTYSEKVESFLLEIGVTVDEIASIKSIMLEEVE